MLAIYLLIQKREIARNGFCRTHHLLIAVAHPSGRIECLQHVSKDLDRRVFPDSQILVFVGSNNRDRRSILFDIQNQGEPMNKISGNIISLYCTNEFPDGRYPHPSSAGSCSNAGLISRFDDAIGMAALAILKVLDSISETPNTVGQSELPCQAIKARDIALQIARECGLSPEKLYAQAVTRLGCITPFSCETAVMRLISGQSNSVTGR